MRTDGQTLKGQEMVTPHLDLESLKEWAKRTLTKGRVADLAVGTSTMAILGVVLFSLHRAMENCAVAGTFPF